MYSVVIFVIRHVSMSRRGSSIRKRKKEKVKKSIHEGEVDHPNRPFLPHFPLSTHFPRPGPYRG